MTRIALVGFGEAAQAMASGLGTEQGLGGLTTFDVRFTDPAQSPALIARAREVGALACTSLEAAVAEADLVLSLVVGSAAVSVGESAGRVMRRGQVFVDLNSISPEAKIRVGEAVAAGGDAEFIEGAVMAQVPPQRHRVPILLAGPTAEATAARLNGLGMACEAVGDKIGQACAVKMIRSVMVKGLEALILESLTAAEKAGVRERILDSFGLTFPGIDWRHAAAYYIGRNHQHGARRVTEMKEAAATLRGFGIQPIMSTAIAQTIERSHTKLKSSDLSFGSTYPEMLRVLADEDAG